MMKTTGVRFQEGEQTRPAAEQQLMAVILDCHLRAMPDAKQKLLTGPRELTIEKYFTRSIWQKKLESGLLVNVADEMVELICDCITKQTQTTDKPNHPFHFLAFELIAWIVLQLAKSPGDKETLNTVTQRVDYLNNLLESNLFKQNKPTEQAMRAMITALKGILTNQVAPILHLAIIRDQAKIMVDFGSQCLYYILCNNGDMPEPKIISLCHNESIFPQTRSAELLKAVIQTPQCVKIFEEPKKDELTLNNTPSPPRPRVLSGAHRLGSPRQTDAQLNPFLTVENALCLPPTCVSKLKSDNGQEFLDFFKRNDQSSQKVTTGIHPIFQDSSDTLMRFMQTHACLFELIKILLASYEVCDLAKARGQQLQNNDVKKHVIELMNSLVKLCGSLHSSLNLLTSTAFALMRTVDTTTDDPNHLGWRCNKTRFSEVRREYIRAQTGCLESAEAIKRTLSVSPVTERTEQNQGNNLQFIKRMQTHNTDAAAFLLTHQKWVPMNTQTPPSSPSMQRPTSLQLSPRAQQQTQKSDKTTADPSSDKASSSRSPKTLTRKLSRADKHDSVKEGANTVTAVSPKSSPSVVRKHSNSLSQEPAASTISPSASPRSPRKDPRELEKGSSSTTTHATRPPAPTYHPSQAPQQQLPAPVIEQTPVKVSSPSPAPRRNTAPQKLVTVVEGSNPGKAVSPSPSPRQDITTPKPAPVVDDSNPFKAASPAPSPRQDTTAQKPVVEGSNPVKAVSPSPSPRQDTTTQKPVPVVGDSNPFKAASPSASPRQDTTVQRPMVEGSDPFKASYQPSTPPLVKASPKTPAPQPVKASPKVAVVAEDSKASSPPPSPRQDATAQKPASVVDDTNPFKAASPTPAQRPDTTPQTLVAVVADSPPIKASSPAPSPRHNAASQQSAVVVEDSNPFKASPPPAKQTDDSSQATATQTSPKVPTLKRQLSSGNLPIPPKPPANTAPDPAKAQTQRRPSVTQPKSEASATATSTPAKAQPSNLSNVTLPKPSQPLAIEKTAPVKAQSSDRSNVTVSDAPLPLVTAAKTPVLSQFSNQPSATTQQSSTSAPSESEQESTSNQRNVVSARSPKRHPSVNYSQAPLGQGNDETQATVTQIPTSIRQLSLADFPDKDTVRRDRLKKMRDGARKKEPTQQTQADPSAIPPVEMTTLQGSPMLTRTKEPENSLVEGAQPSPLPKSVKEPDTTLVEGNRLPSTPLSVKVPEATLVEGAQPSATATSPKEPVRSRAASLELWGLAPPPLLFTNVTDANILDVIELLKKRPNEALLELQRDDKHSNKISGIGAEKLCEYLLTYPNLKDLFLSNHPTLLAPLDEDPDEAPSFLSLLLNSTRRAKRSESQFPCKGALALSNLLSVHTSLEALWISGCGLADRSSIQSIVNGILRSTSLKWLDLGRNMLGDKGAQQICEALLHHETITHLIIDHNNLTDESGICLLELVTRNPRITYVQLGEDDAPDSEGDNEAALQSFDDEEDSSQSDNDEPASPVIVKSRRNIFSGKIVKQINDQTIANSAKAKDEASKNDNAM